MSTDGNVPDVVWVPECRGSEGDVIFIVDASGSIGDSNFNKIRRFLQDIVERIDVESGLIRVGLETFR